MQYLWPFGCKEEGGLNYILVKILIVEFTIGICGIGSLGRGIKNWKKIHFDPFSRRHKPEMRGSEAINRTTDASK